MVYEGLVLDIDGTILRGSALEISKPDVEAIRFLIHKQIPVVIATGRTRYNAMKVLREVGLVEPIISSFGALTFHPFSEESEEVFPLMSNDVATLIEWTIKNQLSAYLITNQGTVVLGSRSPTENKLALYEPLVPPDVIFPDDVYEGVLNCVIDTSDTILQQSLIDLAIQENLNCLFYVRRRSILCLSGETDKGLALHRLAKRRGWNLQKFVTIGDDLSDIPLFEEVGLGIAIGDAYSELIPLLRDSDEVRDPNDPDLIAACIDQYFA